MNNPYLPRTATIIERIDESATIFTLRLKFNDPAIQASYRFKPGQFNMLYLHGVGEIAISVVSDPEDNSSYDHTIRVVGRVTRGFAQLRAGDQIGVRGPYGNHWPYQTAVGKDILVITGGLGCAPVVAAINYFFQRRNQFGKIFIVQGVKHSDDLIYKDRFASWAKQANTQVLISADVTTKDWPWYKGTTVDLLPKLSDFNAKNTIALMCGPEIMMYYSVKALFDRGMSESSIYLSIERSMQCGIGHCGHCQLGPYFVCKDGPIFSYAQLKPWLMREGF